MTPWKPKIWRAKGVWFCSYYRNHTAFSAIGNTPSEAYESWKWRIPTIPLGAPYE